MPEPFKNDKWMTAKNAAYAVNRSVSTIRRWAKIGLVKTRRKFNRTLFYMADVYACVERFNLIAYFYQKHGASRLDT